MSLAHLGSQIPIKDLIIPVDYQDTLFNFYWNKVSGRGHMPLTDVTTMVSDDKFGQVVAIEDGTTNHFVYPMTQQYSGGGLSAKQSYYVVSGYRITAVSQPISSPLPACRINDITSGQSFTVTGYSDLSTVYIYHKGFDSSNAQVYAQTSTSTTTDSKGFFKVTINVGTQTNLNYVNVGIGSPAIANYWIEKVQVEIRDFATSFVDGTRATGELTYSKDIINPNSFTVNTWVNLKGINPANFQPIVEICSSNHQYNRLLLMLDKTTIKPRLWVDNNSTQVVTGGTSPSSISTNQWKMITLTFDGSVYKIFIDGQLADFKDSTISATFNSNATFNIGGKHWGRLNGHLSNFLISPRAFSTDEISTIYNYSKPLYDPYNYYSVYG